MNTQKEKIPSEVINVLLEQGTIVQNGDYCYAFFPYWVEIIDKDKSIVILHRLGDNVPEELKLHINNQRELK